MGNEGIEGSTNNNKVVPLATWTRETDYVTRMLMLGACVRLQDGYTFAGEKTDI